MKIIRCPEGGRVPEGYCRASCLNYIQAHHGPKDRRQSKNRSRLNAGGKVLLKAANGE